MAGGTDSDGDGLSDALENILENEGAAPPVSNLTDSDGDGAPDYLEVFAAAGAFDLESPVANGGSDSDTDGLSDALELLMENAGASTPITLASDTDGDLLPDYLEIWAFSDLSDVASPASGGVSDTDGDGVADSIEAAALALGAVAPVGPATDIDGDGIPFYYEILSETHALNSDCLLYTSPSPRDRG